MNDLPPLEMIANELIDVFNVKVPPVPIERMLQKPEPGMWREVDPRNISVSFLTVRQEFAPRMSIARLLAREIAHSEWGNIRNVPSLVKTESQIQMFARMLVMPARMVQALSEAARTPATMSHNFEVPQEDAQLRLVELAAYL